jgi:hypothetical protein
MTPRDSSLDRPARCAECGGPARLVRNPFFGSGLSVHPELLTCTSCRSVTFVPAPPRRTCTPPAGRRRGLRRVARWFCRR